MNQQPKRRLIGVNAGAEYLGISPWTLRVWAYKGRIASIKLSTRLLFDQDELDRIIAESERPRTKVPRNGFPAIVERAD